MTFVFFDTELSFSVVDVKDTNIGHVQLDYLDHSFYIFTSLEFVRLLQKFMNNLN